MYSLRFQTSQWLNFTVPADINCWKVCFSPRRSTVRDSQIAICGLPTIFNWLLFPALREVFCKHSSVDKWVIATEVSNSTIFAGTCKISGFTVEGNQGACQTCPIENIFSRRILSPSSI